MEASLATPAPPLPAITGCECPPPDDGKPFFCNRHQCRKTAHWQVLCSDDGRYFQAYEEGRGPGQKPGEKPVPRWPQELPCTHRGDLAGTVLVSKACKPCESKAASVYGCALHPERCVISAIPHEDIFDPPRRCVECSDISPPVSQAIPKPDSKPPPVPEPVPEYRVPKQVEVSRVRGFVLDRHGNAVDQLADSLPGAHAFLICGGPSLNRQDIASLQQRGILIAAVNQVAATHVRPHIWFSVDPPKSFHGRIWEDAAIWKFIKSDFLSPKAADNRHYRLWNGRAWEPQSRTCVDVPNVWFFKHCDAWEPETFLSQPIPTWSTTAEFKSAKKSVMLIALRLLYWLGVRSVYLLGCDFSMGNPESYAFEESKGPSGQRSNNKTYTALNRSFEQLRTLFERHGYRVYNCTDGGGLHAFPRLTLEEAVCRALKAFPAESPVTGLYK